VSVVGMPLPLAVMSVLAAARFRNLNVPRGATLRRPVHVAPHSVIDDIKANQCAADVVKRPLITCSWSYTQGACTTTTDGLCRAGSCGLISCDCEPAPVRLQPPWVVLGLNVSNALSPVKIQRAFNTKMKALHPELNTACARRASAEFHSARRARDTLMALALDNDAKCPQQPSTSISAAAATFLSGRRGQVRDQNLKTKGAQLAAKMPLGLALYRVFKEWLRARKGRFVRGWREWAHTTVRDVLKFPKAVLAYARTNRNLIAISFLSLAFLQAPMLIA